MNLGPLDLGLPELGVGWGWEQWLGVRPLGCTSKSILSISLHPWWCLDDSPNSTGCPSFSLKGEDKARVSGLGLIQSMCYIWGNQHHAGEPRGVYTGIQQLWYSRLTFSSLLKEECCLRFVLFSHLLCCREAPTCFWEHPENSNSCFFHPLP